MEETVEIKDICSSCHECIHQLNPECSHHKEHEAAYNRKLLTTFAILGSMIASKEGG